MSESNPFTAKSFDLSPSELATVLHGLRLIQEKANGPADCYAACCEHFNDADELTDPEIDALCARLNPAESANVYPNRMRDVAIALNELSWNDDEIPGATIQETGGGFICVLLAYEDGSTWFIGTANETWGGSLMDGSGENCIGEGFSTDIDSDSADVRVIAQAIHIAVKAYDYTQEAK